MNIEEIWGNFFIAYCEETDKKYLRYVITSRDRQGNPLSNPHALPGNAIDLTLRWRGDYAPIKEYNFLLEYMLTRWPFRAGIDNTPHTTKPGFRGNVHIHIDLGGNRPKGQDMPFFFKEDNGVYLYRITKPEQIA